jgi:hypothetical protein
MLPKKIMLGFLARGKAENVFLDEWFARFFSKALGVALISRVTDIVTLQQRAVIGIKALVFAHGPT